jgi:CO/xanthine dehydrogenase Mo-binding subunit
VQPADTTLTPVDLGSYSSRVTLMCGMAAIQAAQRLRDAIFKAVAQKLEVSPAALVARERKIGVPDDWDRAVPFARGVELGEALHGVLAFPGSYAPPKRAGKYKGGGVGPSPCYSYSACVVELTVDDETGTVDLENVWIGHDIGRALNPLLVEGQVEGSVYMGIGEALMEEQVFRKNLHKNPSMLEYKSPTTLETPEIHTILVETDDPEGPFGAKEAGQGPAPAGDPGDRERRASRARHPHRRGADHRRQDPQGPRSEARGKAGARRTDAPTTAHVQAAARGRIRVRAASRRHRLQTILTMNL